MGALRTNIGSYPGAPDSAPRFRSYASSLCSRNVSAIDRRLPGSAKIGCKGNSSNGAPLAFATTTPALSDYGGGARGHEKPHLCLGRKPALKLMQSSDHCFHCITWCSCIGRGKLATNRSSSSSPSRRERDLRRSSSLCPGVPFGEFGGSKKRFAEASGLGRKASLSARAQAQRVEKQRRNARAQHGWIAANQPSWLDQDTYVNRIQPRLAELTYSAIASAIQVSPGYADAIRKGKVHPRARHWAKLAQLVELHE
jgi:hypothetical protein